MATQAAENKQVMIVDDSSGASSEAGDIVPKMETFHRSAYLPIAPTTSASSLGDTTVPPNERGIRHLGVRFASTGHLSIPKPQRAGRTRSTQVRLKRQGFEPMRRESSVTFVVRSIRRGTDEWKNVIKPFVADLAFRSLVKPRYYSKPRFQVYECHAAVVFIDLSGYSKITAALAPRGAHAISNAVNDYLNR